MRGLAFVGMSLALAGCATQPVTPITYEAAVPATDAMYAPERVVPGRLEYAPNRDTFAPVLTRRGPYPTQQQANYAYQRALGASTYADDVRVRPDRTNRGARRDRAHGRVSKPSEPIVVVAAHARVTAPPPASIRLFACKPGALDSQTARITQYDAPIVHCATDFLDASGAPCFRETVNFYYWHNAWRADFTNPPRQLAPWFDRSSSPKDPWSWVPGRARYE